MKDKIPWEKWYVNRALNSYQQEDSDNNKNSKTTNNNNNNNVQESGNDKQEQGWSNFQYCTMSLEKPLQQTKIANKFHRLQNGIILDTGLTIVATFQNKKLVEKIHKAKVLLLMNTNAGSKMLEEGDVITFGRAWFGKKQMANNFGFAATVDRY